VPVHRRLWLAAAGLFVLTLAVFAPAREYDFVDYDDGVYVTQNSRLIKHGLSREGLRWAFTESYETNWIPLTWVSLEIDHALFGLDPAGYHATNVVLHAANAALLLLVLATASGALGASAFVAGVFALHPLHVESVAWVSERKDVLSGLFFVLTLGAWVGYARRPGIGRYLLALAALSLGLLAKAVGVTLPFVLLLLDFWPLDRLRGADGRLAPRRALVEKVLMLPIVAVLAVVTYRVQWERGAMLTVEEAPLGQRVANALVSCVVYLRQTLWPEGLAVFYPRVPVPAWQWLAAAAVLTALSAGACAAWRRRPWLSVGWLWYLATLVPMLGLIQVGMQARADRYTYIPQIGLSIAFAWELRERASARPALRPWVAGAGALALVSLGIASRFQLAYWRDTETLFERARQVTADNFVAYETLGRLRLARGDFPGALEVLGEALRIRPRGDARRTLADLLARQGKLDEALWSYAEALRDRPGDVRTRLQYASVLLQRGWTDEALQQYDAALALDVQRDYGEQAANIHVLAGEAWLRRKRVDAAIDQFEKALALDPGLAAARANLAIARLDSTDPEEVVRSLEPLAADESLPAVQLSLASALDRLGRRAEAIRRYEIALRAKPDLAEAANNLAWLLATAPEPALRNPAEAVRWAEAAARASGRSDPRVLDTLAVSLAAAGRFDEAVAELDAALALPGEAAPSEEVDAMRARRAQFAARTPYAPALSP
jgi:tetratricopeptide (TPR) repeat protein